MKVCGQILIGLGAIQATMAVYEDLPAMLALGVIVYVIGLIVNWTKG